MKNCPHCKEEILKGASKCPKCQSDIRNWFARHPFISIIIFLFLLWSIGNIVGKNNDSSGQAIVPKSTITNTDTSITVPNPKPIQETPASTPPPATKPALSDCEQKKADANEKLQSLKIVKSNIVQEYNFPFLKMTLQNDTGHTIDAYGFEMKMSDNFNNPVLQSISRNDTFRGLSQDEIADGARGSWKWQLSLFDNATKITSIAIVKIHFSDNDETVEMPTCY